MTGFEIKTHKQTKRVFSKHTESSFAKHFQFIPVMKDMAIWLKLILNRKSKHFAWCIRKKTHTLTSDPHCNEKRRNNRNKWFDLTMCEYESESVFRLCTWRMWVNGRPRWSFNHDILVYQTSTSGTIQEIHFRYINQDYISISWRSHYSLIFHFLKFWLNYVLDYL